MNYKEFIPYNKLPGYEGIKESIKGNFEVYETDGGIYWCELTVDGKCESIIGEIERLGKGALKWSIKDYEDTYSWWPVITAEYEIDNRPTATEMYKEFNYTDIIADIDGIYPQHLGAYGYNALDLTEEQISAIIYGYEESHDE